MTFTTNLTRRSEQDFQFDRIVAHEFKDGTLVLKVKYQGDNEHQFDIPFTILKKDVPLELAKYIRNKVVESRRKGYYNMWALNFIKNHSRAVRRLYRIYNVGELPNRNSAQRNTTIFTKSKENETKQERKKC